MYYGDVFESKRKSRTSGKRMLGLRAKILKNGYNPAKLYRNPKDSLLKQWDVFLSHASEDKATVALPLTESLRRTGVRVWLDQFQIELGDSVRQKIDQGLANSRFGVVILSEIFLKKYWTGSELDALWELNVVLPVWFGIDKKTLMKYSPLLAGKAGISTDLGMEVVAQAIAARVFKPLDNSDQGSSQIARDFAILLAKPATVNELVGFVSDHPKLLARALGTYLNSGDTFRSGVQLGPNVVDFCTATFQPSIGRLSDYQFVLFGSPDCRLFYEGQIDVTLNSALIRAKTIGAWLQSNIATAREVLHDIPTTVKTKVVAGRRPQPGSAIMQNLQDLNDEMIKIQVRTYDWLLDSALAIAEG
jgi:hypothetical protein